MKKRFLSVLFIITLFAVNTITAKENKKDTLLTSSTFAGLELRNIGPAFMSGRIADIAIDPNNRNAWYVAVGSGGVWKTVNAGITWEPVFDKQSVYSIGCVTIDPNNTNIVWVGTGENVGGRHVAYGDGVYLSKDGGKSWTNMGLKESNHISKIIVHPGNSNVVWVAAQGPLWNKGGDRGLYKTTDGGKNWKKVLGDDKYTGVTDIVIDPGNPDVLYAATWERHRNVAAYIGGGPGSGIHSSTDGGETWTELKNGLPKSDMGKIGIAISLQKPDVIYAAIELDRRTGGVYKSTDRGASWSRQSDAVSGATGPHYYQELYASPHQFDKLYLVDVRMQVSEDGGKTFTRMQESHKHSDNHSVAFVKDDPDYLLVGTDGGIYESFDNAENWRFINNLPVTQFYKLALDDSEPFYYIYGGTQDNNTQGGPSRTDNRHGIRNADWFVNLGGDGHQPATEPGNPAIVYSQSQQGEIYRIDRTTGERVYIKPQPDDNDVIERSNWDSPILVSPHSPSRLYFATQRVWRSDNRGDSWKSISGDLTRNEERIKLPVHGKKWSWDSGWDLYAMSTYNTITSLSESPVKEGVIYAGTDDGIIQVTEDGGRNWRKIEVGSLPGVPKTAFVNDIKADLHDANTVYVVLDNHKFGDLNPYILKSTDLGKSWKSIRNNIPDRTLLWRIVQDHINPKLLFAATEFGIYFTIDSGNKWIKLEGGVPTISFRDLAIQKRENDLVGASFGRGFFILDDYSPLREITEETLNQEAEIFQPRKAWWYFEKTILGGTKGSQGASYFTAPNPPFGAVFTYYLKDGLSTLKSERKKNDKALMKANKDVEFPGWEAVENELRQQVPMIWLTVKDKNGNVVKRIKGNTGKGIHRTAWDLTYPSARSVDMEQPLSRESGSGIIAPPGEYTVSMSKEVDGVITELAEPVKFTVEKLYDGALGEADINSTFIFWQEINDFQKSVSALYSKVNNAFKKVEAMQTALYRTSVAPGELDRKLHDLKQTLYDIDTKINGSRSKNEVGEKDLPSIQSRLYAARSSMYSSYGPTPNNVKSFEIAKTMFAQIKPGFENVINIQIPEIEKALISAGAPWIEGQPIPEIKD
ncbi:MAG: glycosyl hydrolase [Melioribacteraceae bacterium]|nr:glycosyl hydrolase [Melioribacteraceae bacterium]